MTSSTRAFGLSDFKISYNTKERKYDSHYNENYFLAKPEIWVHNIQRSDDIIIIGNSSVFQRMPILSMVSKIKSKLAIGGSPNDLEEEFTEEIYKNLPADAKRPVMISIILNMSLIDV